MMISKSFIEFFYREKAIDYDEANLSGKKFTNGWAGRGHMLLIEADSLRDVDDFERTIGYINTMGKDEQKER